MELSGDNNTIKSISTFYICGGRETGERSRMKKFTNEELVTMASDIRKEFEETIPKNERDGRMSLAVLDISLSATVRFIEKLQENDN